MSSIKQHGYPRYANPFLPRRVCRFFYLWNLKRNTPNFASRIETPRAVLWPKIFCASIVSFVGIIVSSSSEAIYGDVIWSPIGFWDVSWIIVRPVQHVLVSGSSLLPSSSLRFVISCRYLDTLLLIDLWHKVVALFTMNYGECQ